MSRGGGTSLITLHSERVGSVRWARNRAYSACDIHQTILEITRTIRGAVGRVTTTRLDGAGIREAVQAAEQQLVYTDEQFEHLNTSPVIDPMSNPKLWSDETHALDAEERGALIRDLLEPVEAAGLLAAGELRLSACSYASLSSTGIFRYYPTTLADFSTTVRDTSGTGSGWVGIDDYELKRIDCKALAAKAQERCLASKNPVAAEPGRYTVILDPQAVADLFRPLVAGVALDRVAAESGMGPFAGPKRGTSKIGARVLDPRVTLSADPVDPIGGFVPFRAWDGTPYRPAIWIEQGVLRNLAYEREYALSRLGKSTSLLNPYSFRLSGGTASVEQMIASTDRGLLITRLSNVHVLDFDTMLLGGYTRDGLWLIEQGKVTKPVKNLSFVESPLFAFNRIEQIGVPQRVRSANPGAWAWVAPPAKVRDFNFVSVADAV